MLNNTTSRGHRAAQTSLFRGKTVALASLMLCVATTAQAQTPQIIRVEEDWELQVATPDPEANVPQVVCVFGPADLEYDTCAIFEINHGTEPDFAPGGMQLQCWWQDYLLGYGNHPNNREFDAAVDQITFTTNTELKDGKLVLQITNGHSVNWGTFGGQNYLKLSLNTTRPDLNNYNPDASVAQSRITYGSHRVNLYQRTAVRYYTAEGLHHTDEVDAVVFSQSVPQ